MDAPAAVGYPPSPSPRKPWLVLGPIALLLALLAGGTWWWLHRDNISLPDHLGALSRNTEFDSGAVLGQLKFSSPNGEINEVMAGYGPSPVGTILVVARGPGLSDTLRARDANVKGLEQIGPASCFGSKTVALCTRSEGDLLMVVETTGADATNEAAAVLLQEAWSAQ